MKTTTPLIKLGFRFARKSLNFTVSQWIYSNGFFWLLMLPGVVSYYCSTTIIRTKQIWNIYICPDIVNWDDLKSVTVRNNAVKMTWQTLLSVSFSGPNYCINAKSKIELPLCTCNGLRALYTRYVLKKKNHSTQVHDVSSNKNVRIKGANGWSGWDKEIRLRIKLVFCLLFINYSL